MRIAQIAPPWTPVPPPLYGGIEAVVDRLCRGLAEAGHEVLLFTTGDSTCPVPRAWALPAAEGMRIGMAAPEIRHVLHAYDAVQDFDIVHDHTLVGPIYAERYPHLNVVTTIHGPFNDELTELYGRIAERVPILCVSHDQRSCAPHVPAAGVIHHGIDAKDFPFGEGSGGHFLFLGRMAPEKGVHRAAEVAREAGVPLIIVGKMRESWERHYFETSVKPLLTKDVRYVGELPHEEKIRLLASASALVNPIRWHEPFGLVMIEAFACGTPVVSFPEGAAPEIIDHGKTGFLCADEAEMAEALRHIGDIDRKACRAAAEGYFSTRRMVDEHIEFFESLIASR